MLLVVDFSIFKLAYSQTDIRLNARDDLIVGKLLEEVLFGIEKICETTIQDKQLLYFRLNNMQGKVLNNLTKVSELEFDDWEKLFIERG